MQKNGKIKRNGKLYQRNYYQALKILHKIFFSCSNVMKLDNCHETCHETWYDCTLTCFAFFNIRMRLPFDFVLLTFPVYDEMVPKNCKTWIVFDSDLYFC